MESTLPLAAALLALLAHAVQDGAAGAPAEPPPAFMSADEAAEPRGLRMNEAGAFDGYTLFAPLNSRTIHLVDMAGETVHTHVGTVASRGRGGARPRPRARRHGRLLGGRGL
jgi:hypothetical protein